MFEYLNVLVAFHPLTKVRGIQATRFIKLLLPQINLWVSEAEAFYEQS